MAEAPTLITPRLRLTPFGPEHLTDRYVGWLNDAEVVRYSEQRHRSHTRESCEAFRRSLESGADLFWAITVSGEGLEHIGNIVAYVDTPNLVADISILLGAKSAWGQGFGTEAWSAVCDFLLSEGGMRKVTAGTMASNLGMRSIMRKSGMREVGCQARQFLHEGGEVDLVFGERFASPPPPD